MLIDGMIRSGGARFLQIWAALLILAALALGSLAVFTFGAVSFAGLVYLWLQARKRTGETNALDIVNGVMLLLCVVWFIANILVEFSHSPENQTLLLAIALLFPPLIFNIFYLEASDHQRSPVLWRGILAFLYVGGIGGAGLVSGVLFGWVGELPVSTPVLFMTMLGGLFAVAGIASAAVISMSSSSSRKRQSSEARRINVALLVGMILVVAIAILAGLSGSPLAQRVSEMLSVVSRSMPLIFLLVNSYYENRFEFFDVFVKRATLFYVLLAALVGALSLLFAVVDEAAFEPWLRPWIYALFLLPLIILVPTIHRRLEGLLDRHWLGRTFSTVEAVKFFLEGVQGVTTASELAEGAERRLGHIFQTRVRVILDDDGDPGFQVVQRVPVRDLGHTGGSIRLGPRPNDTPYFAQDVALLTALSDVFAYLLQNVRLQQRKQEQEKREQELILDASRSELKALRAQVNPHFLFNALNVIASLTHRDPDRAEATVEQLAEVFRYTLRRSEEEWVRLEDEIEFIRAYLDVEKARFGERLQVDIHLEPAARDRTIPAMMVQTLVENAVKHGVASIRGTARLTIRARVLEDMVEIEVGDNGSGPVAPENMEKRRKGAGYGLRNIRRRLEGYFDERASLEVSRDVERGLTLAVLRIPKNVAPTLERVRG
jgi:two-component system, LytTR family, sensor kinase